VWAVATLVAVPPGADPDALRTALEERAVPTARDAADVVSALWTLSDDRATGIGVTVFATEAAARQRAGELTVGAPAPGGATITAVHLLEVLAHL
jgi:hypothetical protein